MNDLDLRMALHRDADLVGDPSPDLLDQLAVRRGRQRRQRAGLLAMGVAVAVIAAGIPLGSSLLAQPDRSPVDRAPVIPTQSVDPTPAETPEPSPAPGATVPPASPQTRIMRADELYYFHAPSGNIACEMARDHVLCQIMERTFEQPPKPSDCEYDYGETIEIKGDVRAELLCVSDTVFGAPDDFELAYGERITNGIVTCASATSGMSCSTVGGSHGFELSRGSYRLY